MKQTLHFLGAILLAASTSATVLAQTNHWQSYPEGAIPAAGTRYVKASTYLTYRLDVTALRNELSGVLRKDNPAYVPVVIRLPKPDGTISSYRVAENTTMHPDLAAAFPEIRSFDGVATDNNGEVVKFDLTLQGFHAMILAPGKPTMYIDPYAFGGDLSYYIVYARNNALSYKSFDCQTEALTQSIEKDLVPTKSFGSCQLRTYRLALSATGEYTTFQGGTVALALSAQVTTMNRVNGVFERDISVTMVIIGNNNLLIYTNAGTDPYTNGTPGSMINENQTNTNAVIGSSNYDIGHVFGTNSGGLAGLGVVCSGGNKARGVTGSSAPVGDSFDIDYVAHEMGHQFDANHTQNNDCNRNNATAMEPGSGTTIMGYAGICAPDIQAHSDDYFHGVSLEEIGNFITGGTHTCPVVSSIPNNAPVISSTVGNVTIPANTPFALTAVASDVDGDVLTYCWEQMNNQVSTQPPVATATGGPSFRSLNPTENPTRYFPSIESQLAGGPYTWEVLPSINRTLKFRVMVRDNEANGSCNDHEDLTVTTTSSAGPFIVNYPTAAGVSWVGNTTQTVLWSVANTNVAPVACANVDVLISLDGGATFTVLANDVPNDGSQDVTVPDVATSQAIIMVMCANGTFFDISDNLFTITVGTPCNNPTAPTISGALTFCTGGSTTLNITAGSLNDATNWQWYASSCGGTPVAVGTSIMLSTAGTYFVRGEGGCVSGGTCQSVTVTENTVNTTTTLTGGLLSSNQNGGTYQWIDCGNGNAPIAGATSQTFLPASNGSYAVQVTANGCSGTSNCFAYGSVGIDELADLGIQLYPNPTSGLITVQLAQAFRITEMNVTDVTGRLVRQQQDFTAETIQLDLTKESKGVYFLNVRVGSQVQTMKITKQ